MEEYKIIDGKRVPVAQYVSETKYGRTYKRLDAPYGYRKTIAKEDSKEVYTVFVMQGISGEKERYATVSRPSIDPLLAFRCFRLTDD